MTIPGASFRAPIERYISHLMYEVPFPTRRRPRVLVELGNETIIFENPENSHLPLCGASYIDLLKTLGSDNAMYLLLLALLEHKILLHSLRPHILTSVAEAIMSVLFPFRWQCPYIPLCPLDVAGNIHAPVPFVIGVDSRYFELYEHPPPDVTCFDLDTNTISTSDVRKAVKLSMLPKRVTRALRQTLEELCRQIQLEDWTLTIARHDGKILPLDLDQQLSKRKRRLEQDIQESFLMFTASLMKGYRGYLKPMHRAPSKDSTDAAARFDMVGFHCSRDKSSHDFYKSFMETQIFTRFVEERSFHADQDPFLVFFDQCMDKVEQLDLVGTPLKGGQLRLLDQDDLPVSSDHTVFVSAPDVNRSATPEGTEPERFTYNGFPKLQPHLYDLENLVRREVFIIDEVTGGQSGGYPLQLSLQRTKVERERAQALAKREFSANGTRWAKCLLAYAYSLWFLHLPAFVKCHPSKTKALRIGASILDRVQAARLPTTDELCYRALIQMCFEYKQPLVAVKVFLEMRREGVQPNAITYALYQRAILEAEWPPPNVLNACRHWAILKNLVRAVVLFKKAAREQRRQRRQSLYSVSSSVESDYVSEGSSIGKGVRGLHATLSTDGQTLATLGEEAEKEPCTPPDQGYGSHIDSNANLQLPDTEDANRYGSLDRKILRENRPRNGSGKACSSKSMEQLSSPVLFLDEDESADMQVADGLSDAGDPLLQETMHRPTSLAAESTGETPETTASPDHPLGPLGLALEEKENEQSAAILRAGARPKASAVDPIRNLFQESSEEEGWDDDKVPLAGEVKTPTSQQAMSLISSAGTGVKQLWNRFGRSKTVDALASPSPAQTPVATPNREQTPFDTSTSDASLLQTSPSTASIGSLVVSRVSQMANQDSIQRFGSRLKSGSSYLSSRIKDLSDSSSKGIGQLSQSYSVDQLTKALWGPQTPGASNYSLIGSGLSGFGFDDLAPSVAAGLARADEEDEEVKVILCAFRCFLCLPFEVLFSFVPFQKG